MVNYKKKLLILYYPILSSENLDGDSETDYNNNINTRGDNNEIYGIGDGTEPTVLYAVGGIKAQNLQNRLERFIRGEKNESNRNRTTLDRLLETIQNESSRKGNSVLAYGNRESTDTTLSISQRQ